MKYNMKRKKKRLKRKFRRLFKLILFIIVIIFVFVIYKKITKQYIISIEYNDNLIVTLIDNDDLYCILSDEEPDINDNKWIKSKDNICTLKYQNEKDIYIKNDEKIVYSSSNDLYYELQDNKEIYLANKDKYYLFKYSLGNLNKLNITIEDKNIVEYQDGYLNAVDNGNTKATIKTGEENIILNTTVTYLITKRPKNYDFNKENLKCEKYTKEENDLIDKILAQKVNGVGNKTRAAVVEAARFLTLDFPYRINYFYENGRVSTNKVDGEGRYYHKGLYIDESRFDDITGSSTLNNKGTWGCSIYSIPIKDYDNNGLDCSGFVSWAILNGGYNPGDIGAGYTKAKDLPSLGTKKTITDEIATNGTIKVGDLLHNERNGGHIAIIVGIDKEYYYVAQAVWFDEVGVVITKYKLDELDSEFPDVVLMDKYYKNDGKLTNMWY